MNHQVPALQWASGIMHCVARSPVTSDKQAVVDAMKCIYGRFFASGREGDAFDDNVFDALDLILVHPELWKVKRAILDGSVDTSNICRTHACG